MYYAYIAIELQKKTHVIIDIILCKYNYRKVYKVEGIYAY